jgi:hypothetical protein
LKLFVDKWTDLWRQVACLPNFDADLANRVFVDVMNEPDSMGVRWEASGGRPGAQQLYLSTADSIWQTTPNKVMFMFEGEGGGREARRLGFGGELRRRHGSWAGLGSEGVTGEGAAEEQRLLGWGLREGGTSPCMALRVVDRALVLGGGRLWLGGLEA